MRYTDHNGVMTTAGAQAMFDAKDRARMTGEEREAEEGRRLDEQREETARKAEEATAALRWLSGRVEDDAQAARLSIMADDIEAMFP